MYCISVMVDTVNTNAARRVEWQNKIKHSYNLQIIVIEPGRAQEVLVSYKHWLIRTTTCTKVVQVQVYLQQVSNLNETFLVFLVQM